jgi:hypothetical protein
MLRPADEQTAKFPYSTLSRCALYDILGNFQVLRCPLLYNAARCSVLYIRAHFPHASENVGVRAFAECAQIEIVFPSEPEAEEARERWKCRWPPSVSLRHLALLEFNLE